MAYPLTAHADLVGDAMDFQGWDAGLALRPRDYLGSGESLADVVRARGPYRGEALHRFALDVAATLARLHMAGIAGLRLDPGNVMIAHNGRAFITPGPRTSDFPSRDVRDMADVIVFAATGRWPAADAQPDLGGLPPKLRTVIDGCRRRSAPARPTAVDVVHRLLGRPGIAHRHTIPELLRAAEVRAGPDGGGQPDGGAGPAARAGRHRAMPDGGSERDDSAGPDPWPPPEDAPIPLAPWPDGDVADRAGSVVAEVQLAPWPNEDGPVRLVPLSHASTPVTRKPRSRPSSAATSQPRSHASTPVMRGPRSRAEVSTAPGRFPHGHSLDALAPLPSRDAPAAPPHDDVPGVPALLAPEDVPVRRSALSPEDVRVFPAPLPYEDAPVEYGDPPVEYEETLVEPAPVWRRPAYFAGVAIGLLIVAMSAGAVTAVSARAGTFPQDGHLFPLKGAPPGESFRSAR